MHNWYFSRGKLLWLSEISVKSSHKLNGNTHLLMIKMPKKTFHTDERQNEFWFWILKKLVQEVSLPSVREVQVYPGVQNHPVNKESRLLLWCYFLYFHSISFPSTRSYAVYFYEGLFYSKTFEVIWQLCATNRIQFKSCFIENQQ